MTFVVNNILWRIEFVKPNSSLLLRSDGSRTVGVTDRRTHMVYISNSLSGSFLHKVLCHEIVHTAICSYDVDLTIEQEELVADLIATYGEEIIDTANRLFERLRMVA